MQREYRPSKLSYWDSDFSWLFSSTLNCSKAHMEICYINKVDAEFDIYIAGFLCQHLNYKHKIFELLKNSAKCVTGASNKRVEVIK